MFDYIKLKGIRQHSNIYRDTSLQLGHSTNRLLLHHIGHTTNGHTSLTHRVMLRSFRASARSKNSSRPGLQPFEEAGGSSVPSGNVFKALVFTGAVYISYICMRYQRSGI